MQYKFHTNLSKEECLRRLSDKTNPNNLVGSSGVIGKVYGDSFYFDMSKKSTFRGISAISKRFRGELQSVEGGTDISGILVSSGTNNIFIIALIILYLIMIVPAIIKNNLNPYQGVFITGALLVFYFFVPRVSRKENIDFIKSTLEAQETI